MSKNITIQEGGVAKQLTVDKLKTNLVGGGTCLWVPEDDVQLGTKNITENGTYNASSDGLAGYSQVTVNVAGGSGGGPGGPGSSIVGTDEDGDESVVSVDEDGNIESDKLPSSIKVITPPTNPYGIYQDGQTITKDGMVVKAYLKTGGEYGTVPNGEITLDPTTAVYDPATDVPGGGTGTSDLETSLPQPIAFSSSCVLTAPRQGSTDETWFMTADATFMNGRSKSGVRTAVSFVGLSKTREGISLTHNGQAITIPSSGIRSFTFNGKTVYEYAYRVNGDNATLSGTDYTGKTVDDASRWTMVWGDIQVTPAGSRQQITASWPQPRTGKALTDTFEILVAPGYTPGGGE